MTQIIINEDFMKLEIYNWNEITKEIFKVYAERKIEQNSDPVDGRTALSEEIINDIKKMHNAKSKDIIEHIKEKYGVTVHRNTISKYRTKEETPTHPEDETTATPKLDKEKEFVELGPTPTDIGKEDNKTPIKIPNCPECKTPMVKSGLSGDKQRFECKKCKKRVTDSYITAKKKPRAPHNTVLFKNWIESNKITDFVVGDFVKAYSQIEKEQAIKIIDFQLQQGNLNQMSKYEFRVRKED